MGRVPARRRSGHSGDTVSACWRRACGSLGWRTARMPSAAGRRERRRRARATASGRRRQTARIPWHAPSAQAESRLPELVPIRYGRMLVSPFTFYRGAAAVMAADLAATPTSGLVVQACGDAHISNFGGFAAPDRSLVFGPNDFDETLPGPWEWDVKRMAASVEIAGRDIGLPAERRQRDRRPRVREYREGMREFAEREPSRRLVRAPRRRRADRPLRRPAGRRRAGSVRHAVRQGAAQDQPRAVEKLTERVDGELALPQRPAAAGRRCASCLDDEPDELEPYVARAAGRSTPPSLDADRRTSFSSYRFVDMARKVVGVGSVGTRAWVFLLVGRDGQDALVLQAKEAQASVLEPYLGASEYENHGERVVRGQRMLQAASDIFLELAAKRRPRRQRARLLRPPALGLEGLRRPVADDRARPAHLHPGLRRGRWPARTPAPATASRSLPTSARAASSTAPIARFASRTPTRTSSTTSGCRRPSPPARSTRSKASDARRSRRPTGTTGRPVP